MNISSKFPSLAFVSMPIIELMRGGELSWAEKEACADALIRIRRHHESMESERKADLMGAQQGSLAHGIVGSVGRAA